MQCNLCGKDARLSKVMIEGTEMSVCEACSSLGNKMNMPKQRFRTTIVESEEFVVNDFHMIIKQARESRNLKQEDAAKQLALKESLLHKMENGTFTPSLRMAKRLEKFFNVSITETISEGAVSTSSGESGNYTIADMIKG